jgi:hypothetical protein
VKIPRFGGHPKRRDNAPGVSHGEKKTTTKVQSNASHDYRERLDYYDMVPSMSRVVDCWYNAVAESFFATIKGDELNHQWHPSHAAARAVIDDYITNFLQFSPPSLDPGLPQPRRVRVARSAQQHGRTGGITRLSIKPG